MTPLPTGTSAVFTGVPLGAPDPDPDVDDVAEPAEEDDVPAAVVVELEAAAPDVLGVVEPPHAARAAAAAAPAPPTPAARSTVRRRTSTGGPDDEVRVVSGCSDMAVSCLWGEGPGLFQLPELVAGSTNPAPPMVPRAAVNHLW
jgi:hypothetical protein